MTVINEYLQVPLIDKTETLVYEDTVRRFNRAISNLSYTEQALLQLRDEQELNLKELASLYGLTISTIKMRLKRIRSKMERYYAQQLAA